MSAQADLPVGLVVVGAEQQDPDALKGDAAPRGVPELNVLAVLRHAGRVGVQLIDQEIIVAPRREVRRGIRAARSHWSEEKMRRCN